ncbi:hypothetical protein BDY19DRAFT_910606 [Irpex rosettiformis]|uniref:Uncharacterized protein n=1 Tax=Irpex rosettiformis TaxID=378272 RepID=A0ACB8TN26_9APHY|nr:hypothetical protein BDY19DRAFT_910606 [Irpex rosettiformis]
MESCPVELLLKIFSHICTDTGQAGCVLSLVSRRFRDISALVRFERICLRSALHMRIFLEMLEQRQSATVVRHLFLYDNGYSKEPEPGITTIDVCVSIISSLASSLVTLAGDLLAIKFTYGSLFCSATSFPLLRDLNLGCLGMDKITSTLIPYMPNLRRFHKFDPFSTEEYIVGFNLIVEHAPQLTHIRISNFDRSSTLPRTIDSALRRDKSSKLHLPKELKLLIVQGIIIFFFTCIDQPEMEEQDGIMKELEAVAKKHDGLLVTPDWGDYDVRDCEVEWREVVDQAGDGCWRNPPRMTFRAERFEQACKDFNGGLVD